VIVGSPRQALAYLYAHHRGPTLARPKYHDAPGGTGRQHWDGALIGAMLYGPRETGGCGVERGGPLDRELQRWASTADGTRTDDVLAVERRLRAILRQHGILAERRRVYVPRVRHWKDPEDRIWGRVVKESENSPCTTVQEVVSIP
jgi:hypothetical protein